MRFLVFMHPGNKGYLTGEMPEAKLVEQMGKYNEELQKAGILLALDGLHPPAKAAQVRFGGGKTTVTDGPFAEAKEVIGGYWVWQCRSREEAIEWARRCPAQDGDRIELRQCFDPEDFAYLNEK